MRHAFYDSPAYQAKQSALTKKNVANGVYAHFKKRVTRTCARPGCDKTFSSWPSDPKIFCSRSCSGQVNNPGRKLSESTKLKIAASLTGQVSPYKGMVKVPRVEVVCSNPNCKKLFLRERYRERKFCSIKCSMKVTGSKPTSPKASRGKAGIRKDISPSIYFYSRWEANVARLYNYLGTKWVYAPRSFDIGGHTYTPDFYLPETDTYVEVKNFWGEYSKVRDAKFRETHKNLKLKVLLKDEYMKLEKHYAHLIPNWEYKNSSLRFVHAT